jgi:uncharacterized protein
VTGYRQSRQVPTSGTMCVITDLPVLLLSDGRPGHFNLAEGIVAAAGRLRPVAITRRDVRRGRWPGLAVATWSNTGAAPDRLLRMVYGIEPGSLPKAALVVSAGAETLGANIACARLLGASNIFYGSLRSYAPTSFDLTLTSYPSQVTNSRRAFALKPSPAASVAWARRVAPPADPPRQIVLLIGGPSGESTFAPADWDDLVRLIEAAAAAGIRWLVSNSRRTPDTFSDRLQALTGGDAAPVARFADVRKQGCPALADLLAAGDAALVTDDSSSMVSDAVAAGLPVIGIAPRRHAPTPNERDYRRHLALKGWYRSLPLAMLTPELVREVCAQLTPLRSDPAGNLADLLAARLPKLFSRPPAAQSFRPA